MLGDTRSNLLWSNGRWRKALRWSVHVILCAAPLFPLALFVSHLRAGDIPLYLQAGLFADDAFYYYQVAFNLVHGRGLTFDGVNTTNGFQPLWMIVLLPVYIFVDKMAAIPIIIYLQALFCAVALVSVYALARARGTPALAAAAPLFLLASYPPFLHMAFHGLEASIYAGMFGVVLLHLDWVHRTAAYSSGRMLATGALLAALNLARLDSLIFSAAVILWLILQRRFRSACLVGLPLAVVMVPYLAANYFYFGALMPVSGAAKRIYSLSQLAGDVAARGESATTLLLRNLLWPLKHPSLRPFLWLLIANSLGLVYYAVRRYTVLALFQFFLVAKYLAYGFLYYNHAMYTWYYIVDFLGPALFVGQLAGDAAALIGGGHRRRQQIAAALLGAALCAIAVPRGRRYCRLEKERWDYHRSLALANVPRTNDLLLFYYAAEQVRKMGIPDGILFGMHNAGVFGYFSGARVVNFDGLINGKERLEYLRRFSYDFFPYLDEVQPVDAYLDFIPEANRTAYDRPFGDRGFVYVDLMGRIEAEQGPSPARSAGSVRLYVRGEAARLFRSNGFSVTALPVAAPSGGG